MLGMFKNHKIVINLILFLVFLTQIIMITTFAFTSKVLDFPHQQKPLLENNPPELVSTATITQRHDGGYPNFRYV
jgi:hypothetical protein